MLLALRNTYATGTGQNLVTHDSERTLPKFHFGMLALDSWGEGFPLPQREMRLPA